MQGEEIFQTIPEWIQSRTPEKKAKKHITLTWKFPWKYCSTTYLPLILSNPKILTFQTKMKLSKCPAREQKMRKKSEKRGEEKRWKVKVDSKFCFLRKPELRKPYILLKYFASGSNLVPRVRVALSSGTGNGDDPCRWPKGSVLWERDWSGSKTAKCTTCKRLCSTF